MDNKKKWIFKTIRKTFHKKEFKEFQQNWKDSWLDLFPDNELNFKLKTDYTPMFNDIKQFEFIKPIVKLEKYYKIDFYKQLIKEYDYTDKQFIGNTLYIENENHTLDEVILQYSKCFKNMYVMSIWPKANFQIDSTGFKEVITVLQKFGIVHCIKQLKLNYNEIQSLFFQLYAEDYGLKNINQINNKIKKCGWIDHKCVPFYVILFETDKHKMISGTSAPLKEALRKLLQKHSNYDEKTSWPTDFLHINDNFNQTVDYCSIYFNKNSIDMLKEQRIDLFTKCLSCPGRIFFLTYKNFLNKFVSEIDKIRFLLFSSTVLYCLGLRDPNDVDMIIYDKPKTKKFDKVIKFLFEDERPLGFFEPSMKGKKGWFPGGDKEYLDEWFNRDWPSLFGAKNMEEVIFNPKFHFYFLGVKIISIEGDLVRRKKRSRPASYANLIALKWLIPNRKEINIPDLPESYWVNHQEKSYKNPKEQKNLIYTIQMYLKSRYNMKVGKKKIANMLKIKYENLQKQGNDH